MQKEFEKIYDGMSIFKNKIVINRNQYNIALDNLLMKKINIIQQGLQLKLDQYVGRSDVIEMILKRGLNNFNPAIAIDDELYTFEDIENVYKWVKNDYFENIKKYLINSEKFYNIIDQVKAYIYLENNEKLKALICDDKGDIDINNINIENIDKDLLMYLKNNLYDTFILEGNTFEPIRNSKYIDNIIPLEDSIKVALYFYKEINYGKNKYEKLQKKIKNALGGNGEYNAYELIIDASISYLKILYDAEFDYNDASKYEENFRVYSNSSDEMGDLKKDVKEKINKNKNAYEFNASKFEESALIENRSFNVCLNMIINKYLKHE